MTWPRLIPVALSVLLMGAGAGVPTLIDAAKSADKEALRGLLKQGANVNTTEGDGTTALHWASYRDDVESVDLLVRAGAKVNATNDLGVTPLWNASLNGSDAMVKRLLAAGADPNLTLIAGESPLMVAARAGAVGVVEQLIAKGANPNARGARGQTALMWAASQKHSAVVKALLFAKGVDIQARSVATAHVQAQNPHGYLPYNRLIPSGSDTALLFAARSGDLASTKLLVEAGGNVKDADAWGITALGFASHAGYADVLEYLLEKGADPNADGPGVTPLHNAVMRHDERMVEALLNHGADPNKPLRTWTPLRRASIDWAYDPEFVGATPFWIASRWAEPTIMRMMLKHGADPKFVHHSELVAGGRGSESVESHWETRKETVSTLMAVVGMGGGTRWRPSGLEHETERPGGWDRGIEAVKILLDAGVDVNIANTDGRTALDGANAFKHQIIADMLIAKGAKPGARPAPAGPARMGGRGGI